MVLPRDGCAPTVACPHSVLVKAQPRELLLITHCIQYPSEFSTPHSLMYLANSHLLSHL
jgi:hypothetical protein